MKKYLSIIVGLTLVLGAVPALAANDLSMDTNVQIAVTSETFSVLGTSTTVDSIVVDTASFTVTLAAGARLAISSSSGNQITTSGDLTKFITSITSCDSSLSSVSIAASATVTVTVTPGTTVCAGSGFGGGFAPDTTSTDTTTTDTTTTTTPTVTSTPVASSVSTTPTVVSTPAVSTPSVSVPAVATVSAWEFRTPLKLGSTGTDVTELQKRLMSEGLLNISSATNYFGPLTLAAVKKYQENHGVATAGQAGYGNVGPNTRASLNSSATAAPASSSSTAATIAALQTQLQALQAQLLQLLGQQLQLLQQ